MYVYNPERKNNTFVRFGFPAIKFRIQLPCAPIEGLKWISIASRPPVHLHGSYAGRVGPDKKRISRSRAWTATRFCTTWRHWHWGVCFSNFYLFLYAEFATLAAAALKCRDSPSQNSKSTINSTVLTRVSFSASCLTSLILVPSRTSLGSV